MARLSTSLSGSLDRPALERLYCSVDPALYYPEPRPTNWDLAYLGTYARDRHPALEELMLKVARASTPNSDLLSPARNTLITLRGRQMSNVSNIYQRPGTANFTIPKRLR